MAIVLDGVGTVNGVTLPTTGFGKVLQVVRATDTTQRITTSTSFVDANISVTITPQKSTSAVLLMAFGMVRARGSNYTQVQIATSSNVAVSGAENMFLGFGSAGDYYASLSLVGYATPATISAVTYKIRIATTSAVNPALLYNDFNTFQLYAIEIAA